jgi:hypothetical protein
MAEILDGGELTVTNGGAGGRPSKYEFRFNKMVYGMALLGATDVQMAEILDISEATFHNWKHDYPKFLESIKKGKAQADAVVAASLLKRAVGYDHTENDYYITDKGEKILRGHSKRHIPPDTRAIMFWLSNRQPELWRNRTETEHQFKAVEFTNGVPRPSQSDDQA